MLLDKSSRAFPRNIFEKNLFEHFLEIFEINLLEHFLEISSR